MFNSLDPSYIILMGIVSVGTISVVLVTVRVAVTLAVNFCTWIVQCRISFFPDGATTLNRRHVSVSKSFGNPPDRLALILLPSGASKVLKMCVANLA